MFCMSRLAKTARSLQLNSIGGADRYSSDIEQLQHFGSARKAVPADDLTVSYSLHPCVVLTALEVLGYSVVSCTAGPTGPGGETQYLWTLHKDFPEPEPDSDLYNHH